MNSQIVDSVGTRTGFRKTEFGNGLFKLNDRTLQIKGYAQRTTNEWPALGNAVPAWLSDYSNRLMVESNANLVRWMHVTPWKQDVESCDRVGLLQAMPAGDAERDVEGRRWEQRKEVMRDAIIYNRNSPSIIFYESGNESISEPHMAEMKEIRDKYDPHGGRAIGSGTESTSTNVRKLKSRSSVLSNTNPLPPAYMPGKSPSQQAGVQPEPPGRSTTRRIASVFTKNPINDSTSERLRPATGEPITTSS